jgi:hypothetical protein
MSTRIKAKKGQTIFHASVNSEIWKRFTAYLEFSKQKREKVLPGLISEALDNYLNNQVVGSKQD